MIHSLPPPTPFRPQVRTQGVEAGWKDFASVIHREFGSLAGKQILDVGGADGGLVDYLGSLRTYYVVDCLPYVVDRFSRGHIQGDAHALPFRDGSVEIVCSKQTLVHFSDPLLACGEMCRVAREGVVLRQDFPDGGPIGWVGHSKVLIDSLDDIIAAFPTPWRVSYTGLDFVGRRE